MLLDDLERLPLNWGSLHIGGSLAHLLIRYETES
jgi:hypothetical protein